VPLIRKFFFTGIGLVLVGLARLAFNEVAQLQFGREHSGQLNMALSLALLLSMPAVTAFGPAALRFVSTARGEDDEGRARKITSLLSGLTAGVLVVIAAIVFLFQDEIAVSRQLSHTQVYYAIAVLVAFGAYQFSRNLCYAMNRVGTYSVIEAVAGITFFATLAAMALLDAAEHLLLAFVFSYSVFALCAFFILRKPSSVAPKKPVEFASILTFSFWAFLGTTASWGMREISVIISADFSDLRGVAHLGWCVAFLTPLQFFPRVIRTVIFAETAERSGRGEQDQASDSVSEISHWIALFNLPLCGVLILLSSVVLDVLTPNASAEYIFVLQIMVVAIAFDITSTSAASALSGAGYIRLNMLMSMAGLLSAVLVWVGLGYGSGVTGVAWGLCAASVVRGGGSLLVGHKVLSIRLTRQPLLCAGLVLAIIMAVVALRSWPNVYAVSAAYLAVTAFLLRGALSESRTKILKRMSR
jgi:O-antigen/teichoic acid export membrane protein